MNDIQLGQVAKAYDQLLNALEFTNPHFKDTPWRVARMWRKFIEPEPYIPTVFIAQERTGYIIIKDHKCYSFCPHHLLPVTFTIKVGYLPHDKTILGLSKLARICNDQMRKLPVQEDLGGLIAKDVQSAVKPKGIGIVINGEHMCMQMRGVESSCATATTTFMSGILLTEKSTREEFLLL